MRTSSKSKLEDALNAYIICFDIPELNKNWVEANFWEGDKLVKKYINIYHKGDKKYNLSVLMFQILDLGDSYECCKEAANKTNLANMMKQALNHGKVKKKWMGWSKHVRKGHSNSQKLGEETFRNWAYKEQVEAIEDRKLKLQEDQPLRDSINRLFAIYREIPYLGMKGCT